MSAVTDHPDEQLVTELHERIAQLENEVSSMEENDSFYKNKIRDFVRQNEIEANNTRIVQEQYNSLKTM